MYSHSYLRKWFTVGLYFRRTLESFQKLCNLSVFGNFLNMLRVLHVNIALLAAIQCEVKRDAIQHESNKTQDAVYDGSKHRQLK